MWRVMAIFVLVLAGCGHGPAYFDASGFHSTDNPYSIHYADPQRQLLISDEWTLTNYEHHGGRPTKAMTKGAFEGSLSWRFRDGEVHTVKTTTFELELSHNSNAVIWVRLLPIPADLLHKKVEFLAENFVNNLSGNAYSSYLGSGVDERRVATKILSSQPIGLRGLHAQIITFDLVSLDQLELDPNAPRTRVDLVLARTNFRKVLDNSTPFEVPAYLLVAYANDAEHFESQLDTFRAFVRQIEIGAARE